MSPVTVFYISQSQKQGHWDYWNRYWNILQTIPLNQTSFIGQTQLAPDLQKTPVSTMSISNCSTRSKDQTIALSGHPAVSEPTSWDPKNINTDTCYIASGSSVTIRITTPVWAKACQTSNRLLGYPSRSISNLEWLFMKPRNPSRHSFFCTFDIL